MARDNSNVVIATLGLDVLQARVEDGERVDTFAEFSSLAPTKDRSARLFIDVFRVAVGEAEDLESFRFRIGEAVKPENLKAVCRSYGLKASEPSWVPKYAESLQDGLCVFGRRNIDHAAEAGQDWAEAVYNLQESEVVNGGVKTTLLRTAVRSLSVACRERKALGSQIAAQSALRILDPTPSS